MFEAILWDCDGCLIDSEWIVCAHVAAIYNEAGYAITLQDFVDRFCGVGPGHRRALLADLSEDVDARITQLLGEREPALKDRLKAELKAIQDIEHVLGGIALPMAIASGSGMERLKYTLGLTNLYERFAGRIFNSAMVANGKPHPDIFLYAAEQLKVAPEKCLVVEDSLNGVRAGKAAGMTVFGFTGGSHVSDKRAHEKILRDLGADRVMHGMAELPALMAGYSQLR